MKTNIEIAYIDLQTLFSNVPMSCPCDSKDCDYGIDFGQYVVCDKSDYDECPDKLYMML